MGDGCTVVTGLAAVVMGECVLYNPDSFPVSSALVPLLGGFATFSAGTVE